MRYLVRAFVYTCAFIGAGWFGDWTYLAVREGGLHALDRSFYIVVGAGIAAGFVAATVLHRRGSG